MATRVTRSKSKYFADSKVAEEPKDEEGEEEVEVKVKVQPAEKPVSTKKSAAVKVPPKPAKKKKDTGKLPSNWRTVYDNIVKMRAETPAAVDTMGCDQCVDADGDEKVRRFQCLVSLMLSSQTRDPITFATMEQLKSQGLSVQFIEDIDTAELERLIKSVSFFRRKALYLKRTAAILREQYGGDIPRTLPEMLRLPGVGPKMAHLAMKTAWGEVTGIAVDTHVHRVSNRLRWAAAKTPEQTMAQLEGRLPRELWWDVNHLLVGFGQSICLPVKPRCADCLNRNICPASTSRNSSKYSF